MRVSQQPAAKTNSPPPPPPAPATSAATTDAAKASKADAVESGRSQGAQDKLLGQTTSAAAKKVSGPSLSVASLWNPFARPKKLKGGAIGDVSKKISLQLDIAKSPNAKRAKETGSDLARLQSKPGGQRITPEIRESLLRGVAEPRTSHERGQEGVLGRKQANDAAKALVAMDDASYDRIKTKLDAAKSPTERALILKSVAARKGELTGKSSEPALRDIETFSDDIRGTKREELIRTTSGIDLDGKNTAKTDPEDPNKNLGDDQRADNDGLSQRYNNSCAPTAAQIAKAEADPIDARKLHAQGIDRMDSGSDSAKEQKAALNGAGSKADHDRVDQQKAVDEVGNLYGKSQKLPDYERGLVEKFLSGKKPKDQHTLNKALKKMGTDQKSVDALRARVGGGEGMNLGTASNRIAKERTGIDYKEHSVGKDGLDKKLPDIDQRLKNGKDVPISVDYGNGEAGHALILTDVRPSATGAKYLVSDPYTGRTAWVDKKDLVDGSFTEKHFDLSPAKVDTYYGD